MPTLQHLARYNLWMPGQQLDLNPVTRITINAVGQPGQRTFYIQGRRGSQKATLICEKETARALAETLLQVLDDLRQRLPDGSRYQRLSIDMELEPPVSADFRVGQMSLNYDEGRDLIIITCRELLAEDVDEEQASVVRFFCSRAQIDALANHTVEVVSKGRPVCALCGKPMDAEGNVEGFCPRRNGHSDEMVFA
jgi:uncharacterized repeat protein (TIGR03847 family)